MSSVSAHLRLFRHNWKLGLLTFILAALFLLFPVVVAALAHRNLWWFTMAAVFMLAAVLAGFTAETQKNLMSSSNSFLLPDLEHTILRVQGLVMAGVGVAAFLTAYLCRALTPVTNGTALTALTLTSLTLAVYTLVLLADWFIANTAPLASVLVLPYFLYLKLGKEADLTAYQRFFSHAEVIISAAAVIIFASYRILSRGRLARRLAEQPYLSLLDLYRPAKAQRYRSLRAAGKGGDPARSLHQRPLQGILNRCLTQAVRSRSTGRNARALLWETLYLGLATSVPRRGVKILLAGLVLPAFILATGYFDSYSAVRHHNGLRSWFPAFPFVFALIPVAWCQFLGTVGLSLPPDRHSTRHAGYRFVGWATLAVAVASGLIWALFHLAASIMPTWGHGRYVWSFLPPRNPHILFLPLLVLPVMLAVHLLYRRSRAQFILSVAGLEIFIVFHAVLNMGGYGWPLAAVLAVSGASWAALPWLWRRRIDGDWQGEA